MNNNYYIWLLCCIGMLFLLITGNGGMADSYTEVSLKQQADSYMAEKSYKRAIDNYKIILQKYPKTKLEPELGFQIGRCYELLDNYADAKKSYEENIKKFPSDIWGGGRSSHYLAKLIIKYGYYEDVQNYYDKAFKVYSSSSKYKPDLIEMYFDRAVAYIMQEEKESEKKVMDCYNKILALKPSSKIQTKVYYAMGHYYYIFAYDEKDKIKTRSNYNKAIELWQTVINKFPKSEYVDESQYLIGRVYHILEDFNLALAAYKKIPKSSSWYKTAVYYSRDITDERLTISVPKVYFSKEEVKFNLSSRNLKNINFSAYEVDPIDMLKKMSKNTYGYQFWHNNPPKGQPVKSWAYDTKDTKEHKYHSAILSSPLTKAGAYLIVGTSGNKKAYVLVLITNLAMITKADNEKVVVYCTDADTGEPVTGAQVAVRESYYSMVVKEKLTDKTGVVNLPSGNYYSNYIIARYGDNYAFSESYYSYYQPFYDNTYNMYAYTDRPVYRPNQKVFFKSIMRVYQKGELVPVNNRKVKIKITDPSYNTVYEEFHYTNKYGTLNGELVLGEEPPLGLYRINAEIDNNTYVSSSTYSHFRVEEYKKPEYEVTVNTAQSAYVIGDTMGIDIKGKYYFGAPVTDGDVKYTVTKKWYLPYYYWWRWDRKKYNYYGINGQKVVSSGEGKVDANGIFHIDVQTEEEDIKDNELKPYLIYSYSIDASIVDKSRREIKASKTLNIGKASFYFTIAPEQSIYSISDKCKIKIKAASLNEDPVKTKFTFSLLQSEWQNNKWDYIPVDTIEKETDEDGTALIVIDAKKSGYFTLKVKSTDDKGRDVTAETTFWIADKNFRGGFYHYQGVEIITDKKSYLQGDVAKILINTEHKDSTVFLTLSADKLYEYQVIKMEGNSKLLEIPITDSYAPNIFLEVALIKNHQVYKDSKELPVTPIKNYLNVKVNFSKAKFQPGENTEIEVLTTDYSGKPIKSEVSLGITDASVYYIQPEIAPDIKNYYYGYKRSNGVYLRSSFDFSSSGITKNIKPEPELKYSPLPGPDFFGFEKYFYARGGSGSSEEVDFMLADGVRNGRMPTSPKLKKAATEAEPSVQEKGKDDETSGEKQMAEPKLREFFPDTILWQPCIETNNEGVAKVKITFPDSLTTWKATARALTFMTRIGSTVTDVVTSKNLLVRLQAPRFFTERDEVYISGIVHNYLDAKQKVKMQLKVDGLSLLDKEEKEVEVEKNGEYRVDWKVKAEKAGMSTIILSGLTPTESDAVKMRFPVLPHGIDKHIIRSGSVKDKSEIIFNLPKEHKDGSQALELVLSPSMAITMLDALPYLAKYPYGCVEQTMSRFLPSVLVAKTLSDLKITLPKDKLDKNELDKMIKAGIKRLTDFHHYDGGWGWWKDDSSNPYMTAYVVFGLTQAQRAGYNIGESLLTSGLDYIVNNVADIKDLNTKAYMLFVLSYSNVNKFTATKVPGKELEKVWDQRDDISNYSRALLAMTLDNLKDKKRAEVVIRNIEDRRTQIDDTAYWGQNSGYYYWYDDAIETTAYVLKAFIQVTPNNKYIEPVAKWLVLNRRSTHWKSTKDTANVVYAMIDYLKHTNELAPDYTLNVSLNGKAFEKVKIDKTNLFTFKSILNLPQKELIDGDNILTIAKDGKGSLYYTGTLKYYTLEEDIKGVANEMTIKRDLKIVTSKVVNGQTIEERKPFTGKVKSGDIIEVNLTIKVNNDFEYMMFEDPKPAGCEPVELRSGYSYGNGICSNMELRDERVTFFATWLPKGEHSISYKLRSEIPGDFHQMPTKVTAMYVPEIWGIADENRWNISDK